MKFCLSVALFFWSAICFSLWASEPDWSREAELPPKGHRENIYRVQDQQKLKKMRREGFIHALKYPIDVTGLKIPYEPLTNFLESDSENPLKRLLQRVAQNVLGFGSETELYEWLGLNPFNEEDASGIYDIPYPEGEKPDYYMGATITDTPRGKGLTFSCATCHSASLFGKSVMGLTNKRVRANKFFVMAKNSVPFIPGHLFKRSTDATEKERLMFKRTKKNILSVGAKTPQVLGLDTSLPQVALSLARRNPDPYATKSDYFEIFPRYNPLEHFVSDSKPAVWWNLKYKTRWLADGSIVSGNPIHTNFLWNELGRGTDLKKLQRWMEENDDVVRELTAAAFSTKPPRWTDFFPAKSINIRDAKRGEKIFNQTCKKCHGRYEKGWSRPNARKLSKLEKLKTTKVEYHDQTPVKNVGTDPQRWQGTQHFADALNKLEISHMMETVVEPQEGYVPPPLPGIWARYPYFHNNSVPNLCALLTPPKQRPERFVQGPANDKKTDFTQKCVGYPVGEDIPESWWEDERAIMDTTKPGLTNSGHYRMLLNEDGSEKYTWQEKLDLIEYLKTL